jgi:hypothetical protein
MYNEATEMQQSAETKKSCYSDSGAGWWEGCAIGTPQGDDELAAFSVLAYSPDFAWMSIPMIAKRSGLDTERVRAVVKKHEVTGLIRRHPSRPDLYGETGAVDAWLAAVAKRVGPQVAIPFPSERRREPEFYTCRELQERWRVSRMTIHREVKRGRLKKKMIAGTIRFARKDVEAYERLAG